MVKRKLTVGGLIGYLASVSHYHKYVTAQEPSGEDALVLKCWCFPHAISLRNVIPGSLLPLFRTDRTNRPAFTFLTKRYNVVLSVRITLCTIAVGTKSFPAPASNVECS